MLVITILAAAMVPPNPVEHPARTVILIADVNSKGRAERCIVKQATEDAAYDKFLCATLLKKMRWKPAQDDSGRPIASRVEVPVEVNLKP